MASQLALLLLGLALAWAGQADAGAWKQRFPPLAGRGDTCPGYCTCTCMPPPSPSPPPPSPRPPRPRPPRPSPPRPSPPPSPRPPRPPRPSPPVPPSPSPSPPPPPDPPGNCPYNKLRPRIVNCSQKPDSLPFKLLNQMTCKPHTDSEGRLRNSCEFFINPASCSSHNGCNGTSVAKSLFLLAKPECFAAISQAWVTTPTDTKKVFAHYDSNTCLIKYTLTTSTSGAPPGSKIKILLPATGECSDMIKICRPGAWLGVPYCFAALADFNYDKCPFQQVKVM